MILYMHLMKIVTSDCAAIDDVDSCNCLGNVVCALCAHRYHATHKDGKFEHK